MKNTKICFAASSGGHFEQLMMLAPLMDKYESFVVTEKTNYSIGIVANTPVLITISGFSLKKIFNDIKKFKINFKIHIFSFLLICDK